eukprot:575070-Prorocentrum_minimum.AAC.6
MRLQARQLKSVVQHSYQGAGSQQVYPGDTRCPKGPSPGVDCRPAMWQSIDREYTSNIRWNVRNAVR